MNVESKQVEHIFEHTCVLKRLVYTGLIEFKIYLELKTINWHSLTCFGSFSPKKQKQKKQKTKAKKEKNVSLKGKPIP